MNAKNDKNVMTTLVTGVIWGGLTLGCLATVGCEQVAADAAAKFASSAQIHAVGQPDAAKPELRSGIRGNHNETFLTAEVV